MPRRTKRPPIKFKKPTPVSGKPGAPGYTVDDWFAEIRERIRSALPYYEFLYQETKHPLHLWTARRLAREAQLPVPASVEAYFDRVGDRFLRMSAQHTLLSARGPERRLGPTRPRASGLDRRRSNMGHRRLVPTPPRADDPFFTRPSKGNLAKAVYHALEFTSANKRGGPQNLFRMCAAEGHDAAIAIAVMRELEQGAKLDMALDTVVRTHPLHCDLDPLCPSISRTTVHRLWKKHAKAYWEAIRDRADPSGR